MSNRSVVRQGLIVGLIASVAVALFYAVFDQFAARGWLYTVDLLGKAVFRGLRDPAILQLPVEPDMAVVLRYNALHLAVSLAIGLVVTGLLEYADRHPSRAPLCAFVIVGGFFVTILAVGWLTQPFRPLLPWWSIVLANALAVLLAGAYLIRKRPGVARRLLTRAPGTPTRAAV
jgi:hypothetical protein